MTSHCIDEIPPATAKIPLPVYLQKTANYILSQQTACGAIAWFDGHFLDPWDHIEAAMGLTVAGQLQAAKKAYRWLAYQQESDGSWFSEYHKNEFGEYQPDTSTLKQSHHVAYIATGLWHYFLCTNDLDFIKEIYPTLDAALTFILPLQTDEGEFSWALNPNKKIQEDALVTACSSILKSLECACLISELLGKTTVDLRCRYRRLKIALSDKPHRFDRTWPAKTRFSMDWFYPIFCGALSKQTAKDRLNARWQTFVINKVGCKCVSDEPWVTTAETCELIFALQSVGENQKAQQLFQQLLTLQDDSDGGFWTGIVTRDNSIWPKEKTTWTAGAILLAADTLYQYSNGHAVFSSVGA